MPKGKPLSAAHKRAISRSLKGKGKGPLKTKVAKTVRSKPKTVVVVDLHRAILNIQDQRTWGRKGKGKELRD